MYHITLPIYVAFHKWGFHDSGIPHFRNSHISHSMWMNHNETMLGIRGIMSKFLYVSYVQVGGLLRSSWLRVSECSKILT